MPDPLTIGALAASAISMAVEELIKTSVGEAVKDAYKALKDKVAHLGRGRDCDAGGRSNLQGKAACRRRNHRRAVRGGQAGAQAPGGKPPSQAEGECAGNWSRCRSSDRLGDGARQSQRYKRRWRPCSRRPRREAKDRRHFGRQRFGKIGTTADSAQAAASDHRGANHQFDRRDSRPRRRRCADARRPSGAA